MDIHSRLDNIERRYNPDNDIGPGPVVTWAEYDLMLAAKALIAEVSELRLKNDMIQENMRGVKERIELMERMDMHILRALLNLQKELEKINDGQILPLST